MTQTERKKVILEGLGCTSTVLKHAADVFGELNAGLKHAAEAVDEYGRRIRKQKAAQAKQKQAKA